jgi:hypothetical protein
MQGFLKFGILTKFPDVIDRIQSPDQNQRYVGTLNLVFHCQRWLVTSSMAVFPPPPLP